MSAGVSSTTLHRNGADSNSKYHWKKRSHKTVSPVTILLPTPRY